MTVAAHLEATQHIHADDDGPAYYAMTPVSVIRHLGLSDRAFRMYTNLDARITSTGGQAIRIGTLADDLGISPRTAFRALAELREAGLACPIHDPHRGHASLWTIVNDARKARSRPNPPPRPATATTVRTSTSTTSTSTTPARRPWMDIPGGSSAASHRTLAEAIAAATPDDPDPDDDGDRTAGRDLRERIAARNSLGQSIRRGRSRPPTPTTSPPPPPRPPAPPDPDALVTTAHGTNTKSINNNRGDVSQENRFSTTPAGSIPEAPANSTTPRSAYPGAEQHARRRGYKSPADDADQLRLDALVLKVPA